MLLNLHVKNLALIEESEVTFGSGLNILSGETGAGKSIIIGSVNLALGGKVSKSMLRENAEFALVELIFSVEHKVQEAALRELEVYPEDGEIDLLQNSTLPVSEISERTGFQSLNNFRKIFFKYFNMTPSEYRKTCTTKHTLSISL